MIVGFPEEGPDDFARSLSLIREISPNKVNITRFSARPGTPAVGMKNIIDRVKKERSRLMQDDCNRVYKTINSREIGSVVPVLITERVKSGSVMGRTPSYAGVVIKGDLGIGYSGLVALREEHGYYFTGELVSREDKL